MALPEFNSDGDLPPGVHKASLEEVVRRYGSTSGSRKVCTERLVHILDLASRTGFLRRLVIFGSYVTRKAEPNDVDIILLMDDNFHLETCPTELRALFDHALAQARYGASIFWARPCVLLDDTVESFISHWQIKRGRGKRGIVELEL